MQGNRLGPAGGPAGQNSRSGLIRTCTDLPERHPDTEEITGICKRPIFNLAGFPPH